MNRGDVWCPERGTAKITGVLIAPLSAGASALVGSVQGQYDAEQEVAMIELTEQQMQALEKPETTPPRIVNPRTRETFVLLRVDEYERLKEEAYDDSPWTREELQGLAWEAAEQTGWEEYDDAPEKP